MAKLKTHIEPATRATTGPQVERQPAVAAGRRQAARTRAAQSATGRAHASVALQRTFGNARFARTLDENGSSRAYSAGPGALEVTHPDSPIERQAEAVAQQVTAGRAAPAIGRAPAGPTQTLSREQDERPEGQMLEGEHAPAAPELQREAKSGAGALDGGPAAQAIAAKGAGSPLSPATRQALEPRMGADLSGARIHSDARANEAAAGLNARAFTHGSDIYMARGESERDTQLMAHELTHVVQNGGGDTGTAQRAPASAAPPASQPATPPTSPAQGERPAAPGEGVAPGVLELRAMREGFTLPEPIAGFLAARKGKATTVNARFGEFAAGPLRVTLKNNGKYEVERQLLPLGHPLFAGAALGELQPGLIVVVKGGKLTGYVGLAAGKSAPGSAIDLAARLQGAPAILGLAGFTLPRAPKITNTIEDGRLIVELTEIAIRFGSALSGTVTLKAEDQHVAFAGSAAIAITGLASGEMTMARSPDGLITGSASLKPELKGNFSGSVALAWDGQALTGEGKVGYTGEKLSGDVTLRLMEKGQAAELERQKKAPPEEGRAPAEAAPAGRKRKQKADDYVVFGEGELTFAFNEWLSGTAQVIVDPGGFVTIIGKITPQAELTLFEQLDYIKPLFKLEARAAYGVPVVGNIFIFANVGMEAFAKLGPGKFYNIVVEGAYSTDPEKSKEFSVRGSLNISAAAGLRLRGEAGAGLEVLDHDIKAGAGITGVAGIRGYAEATPTIGYRERAAAGEDKKGEFFIRGDLEIAAQPFLGLSGDLFVELDSPFWSPAPDKKWTWPLGGKEWPVGGRFGVLASVDYVFGSRQLPAIEFKPVEFSAEKFMTDLYSDRARPRAGEGADQQGTWKEKNAPEAAPPAKPEKGQAPTGKPGEQAPAKSSAAAAASAPRQVGKRAEPGVRTAEGKTVKELQDEAARKGKKPEGKEAAKGAGKEEKSGKAKGPEQGLPKDTTAAIQLVKATLETELPKGAQQVADITKVLSGLASKVRPALTHLRAEEAMPGKPKNEGAIGFKVKGRAATGGDAAIATVRFSKEGGVLSHDERWEAGVKGVKRGITQLEERGISEEAIRAQLPRWQKEFGFTALTLDSKQSPWVIEGEMSPGKVVTTISVGQRQTKIGYHGTVSDNVLSIIARGELVPQGGEIYIGNNRGELFSYGADTARKAAFVIKIQLSFDSAKVKEGVTSRLGAPKGTVVLQTFDPILVRVLEMYVRKPTSKEEREEGAGVFTEETIIGETNIRAYLTGGSLVERGKQSRDERWQAGVKGVKRAIAELEQSGVSQDTIQAELTKLKTEFGFTSLTLNTKKAPWVIEGEMSPGREITTVSSGTSKKRPDHSALLQDLQEGKDENIIGLDTLISEIAQLSPHEEASEELVERVRKALAQKPSEEKTEGQLIAEHAWEDETKRADFRRIGVEDLEAAAALIQGVIDGRHDKTKEGERGRILYWAKEYRLFVVRDPRSKHQGTAYIPDFTGFSDEEWWNKQK